MTKDGKIDWCSYFDSVVCVHYKPYDNRLPRLFEELTRVGLIQSGVFHMYTMGYYDALNPFQNLGFNTARALSDFLDTTGSRVCVIENDVAFMRDLVRLDEILSSIPDMGLSQLDKFVPWDWDNARYRMLVDTHRYNNYFFDSSGISDLAGGSFYAMDRDAACRMRNKVLSFETWPDGLMRKLGVPVYTADINAAVQVMYKTGASVSGYCYSGGIRVRNSHTKGYAPIGIRYSDYAVPDGYTDKTLFVEE